MYVSNLRLHLTLSYLKKRIHLYTENHVLTKRKSICMVKTPKNP